MTVDTIRYEDPIWADYTVRNFGKPGSILHFIVRAEGVYINNHNAELDKTNIMKDAILWIKRDKKTRLLPESIRYIEGFFEDKETKKHVGLSFERSAIKLSKLALNKLVEDRGNELHEDIHTLKQLLEV